MSVVDTATDDFEPGSRPGLGSNQYRTKWTTKPRNVRCRADGEMHGWWPDGQVMRCGEVWGTKCQAWVGPPGYTHGSHGQHPESSS
jgi:hypothetical protein